MGQEKIWIKLGLTDREYEMIKSILGREPNIVELGMYSVMWSEHCGYKNSRALLKFLPTQGPYVLQGPGENAGIIDIGDGDAIVMKVESHNHPSAVEPYQGAATGVGGILRDIFTMGARPIASLNSLRFGDLNDDRVKYLFSGVVAGIADYGNCMGIPTVAGEVYFNDCYKDNPLVNAMSVGIMKKDRIKKGVASGVGNTVMLVGSATGRDGIGGASFASEELSEKSEEKRPAVQVGDPFMEKLLLEACLELFESDAVVGIQDMGAAGITSSSCEMAARAGTGIEIDIDKVPKRETGMTPYEIMLSESQERMLVVVKKGREPEVIDIFNKWGLHAAVIGVVTDDGMLTVKDKGEVVARVPAKSLAEAPLYEREYQRPAYQDELNSLDVDAIPLPVDYNSVLMRLMEALDICSKEWVYKQYDYMVRTDTVVTPGSDAAVLRIEGKSKGIALTIDCNGLYCYLNPREGAKIAVAEAARNLSVSGAIPMAITDGLNFGNPEKKEVYWQFREAILGIKEACEVLEIPVISGNVSFYNESMGKAIYPTPVIGMVGLVEDLSRIATQGFRDSGDIILLVGKNRCELGGSEYLKEIWGLEKGSVPYIDLNFEKRMQAFVREVIKLGLVKSAHDVSEGGLAVTIAESCISGKKGACIELKEDIRPDALLFGESQSRVVISADKGDVDMIKAIAMKHDVPVESIGLVCDCSLKICVNGKGLVDIKVEEIESQWRGKISSIMG
ncbi:phosphoribosylformylglycinamidine synthase subunit PurL [Caldanaerobius polysaccharolyticus]|uniref:phosphoribosylformylglycinamidine synthase subunit PurL n=1 Tax=Caldanaerobius polysaccharolyticus TaxID=44256 RepID=UPI000479BD70|nr:phosphoribosylformylglycinamidine synthase subunit PurL [Caldanaerobius polysaccharolyticus]